MFEASKIEDSDPAETREWLESIDSVLRVHGAERAHYLLERVIDYTRRSGAYLPFRPNTAYVNTIATAQEREYPGDRALERRIEAYIRWNAMAMVVQANRQSSEYGGHISTYASAATLYEVGFNHFWRGPEDGHAGDMVYIQGHSSPGIYARAYLEGRLTEDQLRHFREEVGGGGLSSYPHPWLMPDFWQFPTVSMGLGPMMAIYQARFQRYLEHRGIVPPSDRKVWCFLGDGEMDEPESLGAITMPVREKLDNLVFVVNCNLQRLDGPVRGNGKIIQELEAAFLGAGWNVIKVIWGSRWDPLLAQDTRGLLRRLMMECVDGEYQNFKAKGGAYTREHFFGKYAELKEMVANMSDDDIWRLNRGGHDARKVFNAYAAAVAHKDQPTVILAKTVKGYGMGRAGEGQNITHQQKKLDDAALKEFRDRFNIPVSDDDIAHVPYYRPAEGSEELEYLRERRKSLGGFLPQRRTRAPKLQVPGLEAFAPLLESSGEREISTTMALVRILSILVKDRNIGPHIVPIVPDEARTFGMEGMFRQIGIYSSMGQLYTPQDADQLLYYREDMKGQILEEGINEGGAMCSWIAAGTSYANHGVAMVPFYIYYSMFGFQRVGDFCWAAGDMQSRGFLIGGTAGRTTLAGEGLQHQDGHSQLRGDDDPELRRLRSDLCVRARGDRAGRAAPHVRRAGERLLLRHLHERELRAAGDAEGRGGGHPEGHVPAARRRPRQGAREPARLRHDPARGAGRGRDTREGVRRSGRRLQRDELLRAAPRRARRGALEPAAPRPSAARAVRAAVPGGHDGPFVAATDYMRTVPDQIRQWVPGRYHVLGTDGYGRSDSRAALRDFFEVDRRYVVVAALKALADEGKLDVATVKGAIERFGIDPDKPNPVTV